MLDNWQRIERVVKWTGLSVNSFARAIGLSRSENLYQIKRGNNGISRELACMIAAKYPDVSRAWLLTGEGDMFLERSGRRTAVPYFGVDVEKLAVDPSRYESDGCISIPTVDDAECGALYLGRAMGEAIPAGSVVLLRRVEPSALVPGCDYVVVGEDVAMLRRVRLRAGSRTLRLLPVDADNFDEVHLDADKVLALYLVRAVVINKTT